MNNDNERPAWLVKYAEEVFPTPLVNFGGAVKRNEALKLCVLQAFLLKKGSIDDLIFALQRLLGLTERRVREDYVRELFKFGVIERLSDSSWKYIGKNSEESVSVHEQEESLMDYAKKKQKKEA